MAKFGSVGMYYFSGQDCVQGHVGDLKAGGVEKLFSRGSSVVRKQKEREESIWKQESSMNSYSILFLGGGFGYAKDTLTGEAYNWWNQLDANRIYFNDPAFTWKEVKMVMYTEFVERAQHIQKASTRRLVKPQVLQPATQREAVPQRQSSRPVHKPQVKRTQGEYSSTSKPPEVICYRCQSPGHLAKDCPTK
ncbi:hypothetical protein IGI04_009081 [Brassica rapa subsp. trilocularis]|uniref:CCHC-type domain-containing protein n=1 Tax=Brassica rapa subsp. trilocularis TaxID=1813537 RepID=A0ABQ7MW94_BRACM|nr:hypothetical protein IGI04_009081 [Brassica rapa subsp. trilocularis]